MRGLLVLLVAVAFVAVLSEAKKSSFSSRPSPSPRGYKFGHSKHWKSSSPAPQAPEDLESSLEVPGEPFEPEEPVEEVDDSLNLENSQF